MASDSSKASRREFLSVMAMSSAAMLLGPDQLYAAAPDPRVHQIVAKTIAIDMHSHVQIPFVKNPADAKPDPDIDLRGELKRSGFSAVCQTYGVDALVSDEPGEYYKHQQRAVAFEDHLLASNGMHRALTMKDLQTAHDHGEPIIVQSTEGAQFLEGRLERVEETYKQGFRHLQLVHEKDDLVSPIGDVYTAPAAHLGGLTTFGADIIKECNRIGMLVDLAHGTSDTIAAALKVATQPFVVSHTGLIRTGKGPVSADLQRRLINTDIARAVAQANGVVGIWWRLTDTLKEYVTALKEAVDTLGADHVGIGTDTDLTASYVLPYTNQIWPDQTTGFFYAVAGEMLKQGFTPDEIGKVGGANFCRVFAKVTADRA